MEISNIDTNFKISKTENNQLQKLYTLPHKDIALYGFCNNPTENRPDGTYFSRLPYELAKNISYNMEVISTNTSGVRARFSTNSKFVTLTIKYKDLTKSSNMSLLCTSGFTLLEETEKGTEYAGMFLPDYKDLTGYTRKENLRGDKVRNYILYFPLYLDYISEITLGFEENAVVGKGKEYSYDKPILFYGSSLEHGGCASISCNTYQSYISEWNNIDFINLGFAGNALGEPEMAEFMSDIKSEIFIMSYDFNATEPIHLQKTHYNVYKKYREKNPDTPIVLVSAFYYRPERVKNGNSKFKVINQTYKRAISEGDKNIYLVRGTKLWDNSLNGHCVVDGTHPSDIGFYHVAKGLNKVVKKILSAKK